MTPATTPTPRLPAADAEELVSYRAVSPLAVVSLLLGLASAAALIHPLVWFLPPMAAGLAAYSLWVVAARKGELVGRGAALAGLALAILFGVWAPARLFTRQARLYAEARERADEWFNLVRAGRLYEAYELHLSVEARQMGDSSLADYYGDLSQPIEPSKRASAQDFPRPDPKSQFRDFFDAPLLRKLVIAGQRGELVFQKNESHDYRPDLSNDKLTLLYELRYSQEGQAYSLPLEITLTRTFDEKARHANWHVNNISDPVLAPP